MASDDFDIVIEAMLEAPYKNKEKENLVLYFSMPSSSDEGPWMLIGDNTTTDTKQRFVCEWEDYEAMSPPYVCLRPRSMSTKTRRKAKARKPRKKAKIAAVVAAQETVEVVRREVAVEAVIAAEAGAEIAIGDEAETDTAAVNVDTGAGAEGDVTAPAVVIDAEMTVLDTVALHVVTHVVGAAVLDTKTRALSGQCEGKDLSKPSELPCCQADLREPDTVLTPEERDARTVFCMQLAARIRSRDLEDFFSAVGKVRDVRIISDRNSRRSKGIAYVEFVDIQSVPLAIGLTGQRLLGVPIIVQASQAEKNRLAAMANNLQKGNSGPMRLYVGSLHFNITEDMLRGIFEPFGKIENIQLLKEPDTGRSKGFGFITFSDAECARRALEQLNGFELAGRPMKVGHVTDRADGGYDVSILDSEELEKSGVDLGATGRLQLMAKLVEGTGLQMPLAALQLNGAIPLTALNPTLSALNPALNLATQSISTQCFQFSHLFNSQTM